MQLWKVVSGGWNQTATEGSHVSGRKEDISEALEWKEGLILRTDRAETEKRRKGDCVPTRGWVGGGTVLAKANDMQALSQLVVSRK